MHFLYVLTGKFLHILLTLLSGIILARALGPEGRGSLAAILVYPTLLQSLLEGGLGQSAIYHVGQKKMAMGEVMGSLLMGLVGASLIGIGGSMLAISLFVDHEMSLASLLMVSSIVPLHTGISYIKGVLLGLQRIGPFSRTIWVPSCILMIIYLALALFTSLTVETAITAIFLSALSGLGQALWHLGRSVTLNFNLNWTAFFRMFKLGAIYALSLFCITLNYRIDVALLSRWSTDVQVGFYTISTNVGEMLWYLPSVLVPLVFSRSANECSQDHSGSLVRLMRFGLLISLTGALFIGAAGYFGIPVFYGNEFSASSKTLLFLLPGLAAMVVFKVLNADMAGQGKPLLSLYAMVPAIGLNVFLNWKLIPRYGADGASVASTLSYLFCTLLFAYTYLKKRKIPLQTMFFYRCEDFTFIKGRIKELVARG